MESQKSWYIQSGGQKKGPFPESGLLKLYSAGVVTKSTLVRSDGSPNWVPFSQTAVFRDMPPAAKRSGSKAKSKIVAIAVTAILLLAAGFFGFRLWNNTHSLTGAWQGKNTFGGTLTLYFQPKTKVGGNTIDVLYVKGNGDSKTQRYYYMTTKASGSVYQVDYCGYSEQSGTLDEANEKRFTVTLNPDGTAQLDGIGNLVNTISRIDDARAKSILDLN